MSNCKNVCRLCRHLVISTAVAYNPTTNTLDITIPDNGYRNCEKVCIVVAQTIPTATPINALVNVIVGQSLFPLVKCNCVPANACEIQTRTKYCTKVVTDTTSGSFRLLGRVYPCCPNNLEVLPVVPATTVAVAEAVETPVAFATRTTTTAKKGVATNE